MFLHTFAPDFQDTFQVITDNYAKCKAKTKPQRARPAGCANATETMFSGRSRINQINNFTTMISKIKNRKGVAMLTLLLQLLWLCPLSAAADGTTKPVW